MNMTKQEAIEILTEMRDWNDYITQSDALQMAIDELEKKPAANSEDAIRAEIVRCKDCRKHNVSVGYTKDCCPLYEFRGISYGHEHDYQFCCFAERRTDERSD